MRTTIITPTYNGRQFIADCIRNVVDQGDQVAEHIIVDGGSTDGTVEYVVEAAKSLPHLRLIPGPDKGQSDAMNKGVRAAGEAIIGFLNVDDFYEPGTVGDAMAAFAQDPKLSFVAGNCRVVDEHGETVWWNKPDDLRIQTLLRNGTRHPIPANPSAYFYKRSVHDLVGYYEVDNRYTMDVEFLLRAIPKIKSRHIDRHWGNFRLIPGCKSYENLVEDNPLQPLLDAGWAQLTPAQRAMAPVYVMENRLRRVGRKAVRILQGKNA